MPHSPRKSAGFESWQIVSITFRGYGTPFVDFVCADCGKKESVMNGKVLPKCKCWETFRAKEART